MFCINCGKLLNEDVKFCPFCGRIQGVDIKTDIEKLSQTTNIPPIENLSEPKSSDVTNDSHAIRVFYNRYKKYIWIFGVIIAVVILLSIILAPSTERYVGSNTQLDVVVELDYSNDMFSIKETNLHTGKVTTIEGTFELLGTNKNIIKFYPSSGGNFQCEILVNIHGTPFISWAGVLSGYPACYKS